MATQLLLIDLPPAPSAPVRSAAMPSSDDLARAASRRRGGEAGSAPSSRRVRTRSAGTSPAGAVGRGAASLRRGNPAFGRLDDRTRELGLRGVEEARRALAAAVERSGRGTAA